MAGITDKEVRSLLSKAKNEGKKLTQVDGTIPGLTLVATSTGVGSWRVRYYVGTKQKETTIGQYPVWGISDARAKAKELRRAVDEGVDVAQEKQRKKQESVANLTIDSLAAAYFAKAEKSINLTTGMRLHTLKQRKSIHERYVSPLIGSFAAGSVTPAQIVNVVKRAESGGKTLPDITLTHCNLIFAHAVGNAVCVTNPCRDLKLSAIIGQQEPAKQLISLGATELADFLRELHRMPRHYELAVRLMLLTGVRINTIAEATVSEFNPDFAVWEIPHNRRKNRRHTKGPYVIPLPAQAVDWVRELIKLADGNEYLLPVNPIRGAGMRNPLSKSTTISGWINRVRIDSGGTWRRVTPHDLRSTCKSWLSELRVDYEVRQRYLDHSLVGIDAIYDKADYRDHRLAVAEKWLACLNDLEAGKAASNVLKLPNAA